MVFTRTFSRNAAIVLIVVVSYVFAGLKPPCWDYPKNATLEIGLCFHGAYYLMFEYQKLTGTFVDCKGRKLTKPLRGVEKYFNCLFTSVQIMAPVESLKLEVFEKSLFRGLRANKIVAYDDVYSYYFCYPKKDSCGQYGHVKVGVPRTFVIKYADSCTLNKWGAKCDTPCYCTVKKYGNCDIKTGKCLEEGSVCIKQRMQLQKDGPCSHTCKKNHFGRDCKPCNCIKPGCYVVDGRCETGTCVDGWAGPACQTKCRCANDAICDKKHGACPDGHCAARHFGKYCQAECTSGFFLENATVGENLTLAEIKEFVDKESDYVSKHLCTRPCHCLNNRKCDAMTGKCLGGGCRAGYMGETCYTKCNGSSYWRNCQKKCHCEKGDKCMPDTGRCWFGCHHRWGGEACQKTCPLGFFLIWGKCSGICRCRQQEQCAVESGKCLNGGCMPGWKGDFCDDKCEAGFFGSDCISLCHCQRSRPCHHVTGACLAGCATRFTGKDCSQSCPEGMWDFKNGCKRTCACKLKEHCHVLNGVCMIGGCDVLHNSTCVVGCKSGYFDFEGARCSRRCHCEHDAACNVVSGKCPGNCHRRYAGISCQLTCPPGRYLSNPAATVSGCNKTCLCKNVTVCRVTDGDCGGSCNPGYQGRDCRARCLSGSYGINCSKKCMCLNASACHHVTGNCSDGVCPLRYFGNKCSQTCPRSSYLTKGQCEGACHCLNQHFCNVSDGSCIKLGCADGYIGNRCETECTGRFGKNCASKCHCKGISRCDLRNGYCTTGCFTRYTGLGCQTTCPSGRYGPPKCLGVCRCQAKIACDVKDGKCVFGACLSVRNLQPMCRPGCREGRYLIKKLCNGLCHCKYPKMCIVTSGRCASGGCRPGWLGPRCERKCRVGMFGRGCTSRCHCKPHDKPCDNEYGVCPGGCADGYSGSNCQNRASMKTLGETVGIWTGVVFAVVIVAVIVGYVGVYQRNKKRRELVLNAQMMVDMTEATSACWETPSGIKSPQLIHSRVSTTSGVTTSHAAVRNYKDLWRSTASGLKTRPQNEEDTTYAVADFGEEVTPQSRLSVRRPSNRSSRTGSYRSEESGNEAGSFSRNRSLSRASRKSRRN